MRYRLLGPVEVLRDGVPVELGGPKPRAVLALLLLDPGRVVSTDRIIDAVWGENPPASVMGSLQAYISNLRRLLRDDERATSPIVRRPPGYVVDIDDDQLDTTRFTALCTEAQAAVDRRDWAAAAAAAEAALGLWRGPLVVEHADEAWVRAAAAGLEERRASCRENHVVGLLGRGRVTEALERSRQLVDEEPLRERACWLHIVALYRAGRTAEALEVYGAHARRLDDELGLDVGPSLRDVQGAVLRQDADLARWPGPPAEPDVPGVVEPTDAKPVASASPEPDVALADDRGGLVGRDHELSVLRSALDEVRAGRAGGWVALTGAAGIGKTRLAEEALASWQRDGGRVARTGCPEDDGIPAWWPLRQLLRELGADGGVFDAPAGVDADAARFAVYDQVGAALTAGAAAGALLLLVDDVQWADPTSLRFLTHLAEARPQAGLGVLLTVRDGAGGEQVSRLLAAVARRPGARQLAVPPLSTAEVAALAGRINGHVLDAGEVEQLTARTGGNPFFVSEYARLPAEQRGSGAVPVAIRSVLGRRLAGLDTEVLQVLRAAAVIGDGLDLDLLGATTRLDRDDLADLLDEAADERIIVAAPGTGTYGFAHALLRDEIVAGLSGVRLRRLHQRIAEALGPDATGDRLTKRATHLVAGLPLTDATEAFEACRAAALEAEDSWYSESAAWWWGTALSVVDQLPAGSDVDSDELVIAQMSALARAGRGQTVLDVVDAALVESVRRGRLASAGRLAATLLRGSGAWPWVVYGSDPGPVLARLAGLETVVRSDPAAHARILTVLAVGSCYDPDAAVPDTLSRRALDIAEGLDDPDVLADALLGRALTFSGVAERAAEVVDLLDRLATVPHRLAPIDDVIRHSLGAMARLILGRVGEADAGARLGVVGSDLLRLPVCRVQLRWLEAALAVWRGEFERAEQLQRQAYESHRATELYQGGTHEIAMASRLWSLGRLGEASEAEALAASRLPMLRAVVAVARRDADAAELVRAELRLVEPPLWTTHGRLTWLAHAVAELELVDEAGDLRRRLEPFAGLVANIGQVGILGPVALGLARLCLLTGDLVAADRHLGTATELAAATGGMPSLERCRRVAAQLERQRDASDMRMVC